MSANVFDVDVISDQRPMTSTWIGNPLLRGAALFLADRGVLRHRIEEGVKRTMIARPEEDAPVERGEVAILRPHDELPGTPDRPVAAVVRSATG